METQGDRGPGAEPEPPPGLSKGDQHLFREMGREIGQVRADMNEIVKAVNALPPDIGEKLVAIGRAVESLSNLSENVRSIREEFAGFRGFRERIERYEKRVITWAIGAVGTIVVAAFYLGWNMKGISADVAEMKDSVSEAKDSINKLQAATYELNGTMKVQGERLSSQGERLKGMAEQLKAVQTTASETSDKTAERIAGLLQASEKRVVVKFNDFERKIEEASDVLVLWLALNPGDKPVSGSDTTLHYYAPVPAQQKPRTLHASQSRSKAPLAGVVTFYDGEELLKPPGVMAATAHPMKEDGKVPITLFFPNKAARDEFEKFMDRLREDRKPMRLKITFAPG